ncbi:HesA/MoeB/ThiF family protein [Bartonella grahamii]|uniref:HesA/MoeB/ThiF family protein n=1 Tax=Bartonella grahamii TaxID=33045 RepID=UPI002363077F|nr:ThiF family adenylyltransferase [Bartonella grahamii]
MKQQYILGKYTHIVVREEDAIFSAGSKQFIINNKKFLDHLVLIAAQWIKKKTVDEVYNSLSLILLKKVLTVRLISLFLTIFLSKLKHQTIFSIIGIPEVISIIKCYGMHPTSVQHTLLQKSVVILRGGGIGNHVSAMLASSGVRKLTLVDNDVIEITNLTRQILFTEEDIGLPKTTVLKRKLMRRNSQIEVHELQMLITEKEDINQLPKADLWIISADSPVRLGLWINEWCVKNKQAYINSGYVNDIAVFGPFYILKKTGCYACSSSIGNLLAKSDHLIYKACIMINNNFKVATFPPVNALSAAMCANDALKFLGGYGNLLSTDRRVEIWSSQLFTEERSLQKNPHCKVCGTTQ